MIDSLYLGLNSILSINRHIQQDKDISMVQDLFILYGVQEM